LRLSRSGRLRRRVGVHYGHGVWVYVRWACDTERRATLRRAISTTDPTGGLPVAEPMARRLPLRNAARATYLRNQQVGYIEGRRE